MEFPQYWTIVTPDEKFVPNNYYPRDDFTYDFTRARIFKSLEEAEVFARDLPLMADTPDAEYAVKALSIQLV